MATATKAASQSKKSRQEPVDPAPQAAKKPRAAGKGATAAPAAGVGAPESAAAARPAKWKPSNEVIAERAAAMMERLCDPTAVQLLGELYEAPKTMAEVEELDLEWHPEAETPARNAITGLRRSGMIEAGADKRLGCTPQGKIVWEMARRLAGG